jgi:hypothetical protein
MERVDLSGKTLAHTITDAEAWNNLLARRGKKLAFAERLPENTDVGWRRSDEDSVLDRT